MADLDERLVAALRHANLDERYYSFYEQIRNRTTPSHLSRPDWAKALAETGLQFRYNSRERFFSTEKQVGSCTVTFNIAFRHDEVELVLDVVTPQGRAGGPFTLLANSVGLSRDPNFSPTPPYPTLPFSNFEELREIIRFAISLYTDVERALLAAKIC
jgi:hypothetical protein